MSEKRIVTRRGFVGAALLGSMGIAASSVLAGCSAPASSGATGGVSAAAWDEETDVVVVGSGAAGYAAAIEAANAGASVLLLEKTNIIGGDSTLCDGILGAAESTLAKEQGIDVTKDDVYEWFMGHPEWYGAKDPEIARVNADQGGETIDWLASIGTPFVSQVTPRFGYTELAVIHQVEGKGAEMIRVLAETAEKAGVVTMMETPATELVANDEGRVIGVVASPKEGALRIKANKGVVMATGSYSGSPAMLGAINPDAVNVLPGSNPGATGDGLVMGMSVGAFMSRVTDTPLLSSLAGLETGSIVNWNYYERLHGLWLDANGERFFDEETPYENPLGHRAILHKQKEQGKPVVALVPTTPELEGVLAVRPLNWSIADTVEEVATMVGLDPAKVKATVDRYNGFCEAGKDDDFGRAAEFLIPMTGPFYATTISQSSSVTMGGFRTNTKAQALRLKIPAGSGSLTEPIPGLYAAGVVCEWNCAAGATVLCAMTQGRIAGQNVVQEEPAA